MGRVQSADRRSLFVGFRAMTELLRVSGAEDAAGVLIRVVSALGGTTLPARLAGDDALPLDLSCGHGEPLLPVAPPGSASRVRLETMLPALLEEARIAVARAQRLGRLSEQVDVDPLTGLLNRRAVKRLLPRLEAGDAVAVIDLDHFKELNDSQGHAAGDAVLTAFSRLLREQGRAEDHYSRLGGEEFLGIYPATTIAEAAGGVDRLRSQWSRVATFPVTFCAGIAAVGADGGSAAVHEADAAMYAAKEAGRNRTVITDRDAQRVIPPRAPEPRRPLEEEDGGSDRMLPTLLRHVEVFDVRGATDLVEGMLDDGATVGHVIALLSAAQEEVGRGWQQGAGSIADEHKATAVADGVLATVGSYARQNAAEQTAPRVAIACPEGEWHQLPAHMLATLLVDLGLAVTVFGPSLPAQDLERALVEDRHTALFLSCTMSVHLPSAEASIRAAHACGVPVLVGGRAFGDDSRRAERLGADGWAADAGTAVTLIESWQQHPPAIPLPEARDDRSRLVVDAGAEQEALDRVLGDLASDATPAQGPLDPIRDEVRRIVEHLNAAVVLGDEGIFAEFTEWRVGVLASRYLAPDLLPRVYRAIDEAVGDNHPAARHHLRLALTALAAS